MVLGICKSLKRYSLYFIISIIIIFCIAYKIIWNQIAFNIKENIEEQFINNKYIKFGQIEEVKGFPFKFAVNVKDIEFLLPGIKSYKLSNVKINFLPFSREIDIELPEQIASDLASYIFLKSPSIKVQIADLSFEQLIKAIKDEDYETLISQIKYQDDGYIFEQKEDIVVEGLGSSITIDNQKTGYLVTIKSKIDDYDEYFIYQQGIKELNCTMEVEKKKEGYIYKIRSLDYAMPEGSIAISGSGSKIYTKNIRAENAVNFFSQNHHFILKVLVVNPTAFTNSPYFQDQPLYLSLFDKVVREIIGNPDLQQKIDRMEFTVKFPDLFIMQIGKTNMLKILKIISE